MSKKFTEFPVIAALDDDDIIPVVDISLGDAGNRKVEVLKFKEILIAKLINNEIPWAKVNKSDSSLANLATRAATDLTASAGDKILGRISGAGAIEEIACTTFGRSLIDDADAAAGRGTLGGIPLSSAVVLRDGSQAMAGNLGFNNAYRIVALVDPVNPQDGATKKYVDDNAGTGATQCVRKASDESVSDSTTLQNDDELVLNFDANTKWSFELCLFVYFSGSGNCGFKMDFLDSNVSEFRAQYLFYDDASIVLGLHSGTPGSDRGYTFGIADEPVILVRGSVLMGESNGSLTLRWAQNAQQATSAIYVMKGSYFKATRDL